MADAQTFAATGSRRLRIALGVIFVVLGLVALIWPKATLVVVAVVFGLQLIAAGLIRIVAAVALKDVPGKWRTLSAILGVLTAVAGIVFLFRPGTSLVVLAIILGIGWIIDGVSELVSAFAVDRSAMERGGRIAFGLLGILAAVVVMIYPGESLVLLTRTGGVILIALGVVSLLTALAGRRDQTAVPATGQA
jgi:uncharacterized membrane protein HdeD (DUF308 family)